MPSQLTAPMIPHFCIDNAAAAVEFYKKAFGAEELMRVPDKDGKRIMHVELLINGSLLYMHDDYPEMNGGKSKTPKGIGGSPVTMHLNVANCDEAMKKAVDAGATITMPAMDAFWGMRYGQVRDPFGYEWAFAHPLKK